jgi:cation:H+ antiporter
MIDIPVDPSFLRFDLWVMLGSAVVLWLFVLLKARIGRVAGGFFLAGYFSYIYLIF